MEARKPLPGPARCARGRNSMRLPLTLSWMSFSLLLSSAAAQSTIQVLGQLGGSCNAVDVAGNRLFAGEGASLAIYNISNPARPAPLGRILLPRPPQDICAFGNVVYVADGTTTVKIVDMSVVSTPTLHFGPMIANQTRKCVVSNGVLLVTWDDYPNSDGGFTVLSLQNRLSPAILGGYDWDWDRVYSIYASGSMVFANTGFAIEFLDISNPAAIVRRGFYRGRFGISGFQCAGTLLYAGGSEGLEIVDVSNLSSPSLVASLAVTANSALLHTGNYLYAAFRTPPDWEEKGIHILDVSNPGAPALLGTCGISYDVTALRKAGNSLYAAAGRGGLQIVEVGDPRRPRVAGRCGAPIAGEAVAVSDGLAYIAGEMFSIVDVTRPASPSLLGSLDLPGGATAIAVAGNRAYVTNWLFGLLIFDVSNPSTPWLLGSYPAEYASDVSLQGWLAYVVGHERLLILDVSDPTSPTLRGSYPGAWPYRVSVSGDLACVIDTGGYSDPTRILDVSNPSSPTAIGSLEPGLYAYDLQLLGQALYFSYDATVGGPRSYTHVHGIAVADLSNPTTPTIRGTCSAEASGNVFVSDGLAYVAEGNRAMYQHGRGFEIFDVRRPDMPRLKASTAIPGSDVNDIAASRNLVAAVGEDTGLWLFRFSPGPPLPPSGLHLSPTAWGRVELYWHRNSTYEDGFKIERRIGTGGTWSWIATVPAGPYYYPGYTDVGQPVGVSLNYRVRAYSREGDSAPSDEATVTVPDGTPAPPRYLQAWANRSPIDFDRIILFLYWSDSSTNEESFAVEWKTQPADAWRVMATTPANTDSTSYATSLAPRWFFRVRAFNRRGPSPYSNETSCTLRFDDGPRPPSNLTATLTTTGAIALSWRDNSTNEIEFVICRRTNYEYPQNLAHVGPNVTRWLDTTVTPNTRYGYVIQARNSAGIADSAEVYIVTPSAPPANLQATATSDTQILLSWRDNSSTETGTEIYRLREHTSTWVRIAVVGPNVTTYLDRPLPPRTTFYYAVRAFDRRGYTAYSNTAAATTWATPPATPTGLMAAGVSPTQINLTWTDNSPDEEGFKIEHGYQYFEPYYRSDWYVIATVGPNVTSYADARPSTGTIWSYRVRAFNGPSYSPYSNEATAATWDQIPIAPYHVRLAAVTSDSVTISWDNYSRRAVGVEVYRVTYPYELRLVATLPATATSCRDWPLSPLTYYYYYLRFRDSAGQFSPYSDDVRVQTLDILPAPTQLTARALDGTRVRLGWRDNSNNELGFQIERLQPNDIWREIARVGPNGTAYLNTNCQANRPYAYRVRAYNWNGRSECTQTVWAWTLFKRSAGRSSWRMYR